MIASIQAKKLLSTVKPGTDNWFGLRYNLNLYRGCQHGCIYCDSRSTCYGIKNFSDILVKENALELLEKEIRSKRNRGTIGFGRFFPRHANHSRCPNRWNSIKTKIQNN